MRNVLARIPKASAEMVAAAIRTIFAQPDPAHVRSQLDEVARMLDVKFPDVAAMLRDATEDLLAFTAFPIVHWRKIWSTNPLERINAEIKRRTNVDDHDNAGPSLYARGRRCSRSVGNSASRACRWEPSPRCSAIPASPTSSTSATSRTGRT